MNRSLFSVVSSVLFGVACTTVSAQICEEDSCTSYASAHKWTNNTCVAYSDYTCLEGTVANDNYDSGTCVSAGAGAPMISYYLVDIAECQDLCCSGAPLSGLCEMTGPALPSQDGTFLEDRRRHDCQ